MGRYSAILKRTASQTLALGAVTAPSSGFRRVRIYDLVMGCEGQAADNPFLWRFQRCTDAGTGDSVTPKLIDPADVVAAATEGSKNHTVNPTVVADDIGLELPINQRATFRWLATERGELVIPAVASNGFAILTPVATALPITCTVHFEE